jgi:hypothetical protein
MAPKDKLKVAQEHGHHLCLLPRYYNVIIISLYNLKPSGELVNATPEEVEVDLNADRPRVRGILGHKHLSLLRSGLMKSSEQSLKQFL